MTQFNGEDRIGIEMGDRRVLTTGRSKAYDEDTLQIIIPWDPNKQDKMMFLRWTEFNPRETIEPGGVAEFDIYFILEEFSKYKRMEFATPEYSRRENKSFYQHFSLTITDYDSKTIGISKFVALSAYGTEYLPEIKFSFGADGLIIYH